MAQRLPTIGRPLAELRSRQEADLERRRHGRNLLTPDLLRPGVKSAAGVLMTTLGGALRPMTHEDLKAFRRNVAAVSGTLVQGLTRQELIDLSRAEDLERARTQIRHATPTRLSAGDALFVTSAGPDSRVHRHLVHLVFTNYSSAVARPATPLQSASWLTSEGRIRFECTCERFTFWYRYVASVSGCVAGRLEHSFPKIRNSDLTGMGCKHLLRVAHELASPFARHQLAKMIEADRKRLNAKQAPARPRVVTPTQEEAVQAMQRQARKASPIRTTDDMQRRALIQGVRKALSGAPVRGPAKADVRATLAALQTRSDITAQTLLAAVQQVLGQPGGTR
jgi:hypothetical protein